MKIRTFLLTFSIASVSLTMPAIAEDACLSAKDMVRMVNAFYAAKSETVDVIKPEARLQFEGLNGTDRPDQILYRDADENYYLDVDEAGFLQGFETLAGRSKSGELCRVMDGEIAQRNEDSSTSVNVNFEFPFRRADGVFDVSELKEGAKDGSKVVKDLAPSGLGFVVPGLKTIVLRPETEDAAVPDFEFSRDGKAVSVDSVVYDGGRYFRLKDIKSAKADKFSINGSYNLQATFKIDLEELAELETKRLSENQDD